jgi:hypothetical protein
MFSSGEFLGGVGVGLAEYVELMGWKRDMGDEDSEPSGTGLRIEARDSMAVTRRRRFVCVVRLFRLISCSACGYMHENAGVGRREEARSQVKLVLGDATD